jgi:TatD DNase family protein
MFIDSHAHITSGEFSDDRDEVIQRALDAGVSHIVCPAIDLEDSIRAIELAERYSCVYAAVGVHPHKAEGTDEATLARIEELSNHPRVVAIGEIGLDYHYDFAQHDTQKLVFGSQVAIAIRRNLPVIIHTRESIADTVGILENVMTGSPGWTVQRPHASYPSRKGVFHCFSGDVDMALRVIKLGFYISFPGIVTFKKPGLANEVARAISIDHLLLETDSPYLAPVPYRGKRNEPAYVPLVAQKIAELQNLSTEDVASSTRHNANMLFGIGEVGQEEVI